MSSEVCKRSSADGVVLDKVVLLPVDVVGGDPVDESQVNCWKEKIKSNQLIDLSIYRSIDLNGILTIGCCGRMIFSPKFNLTSRDLVSSTARFSSIVFSIICRKSTIFSPLSLSRSTKCLSENLIEVLVKSQIRSIEAHLFCKSRFCRPSISSSSTIGLESNSFRLMGAFLIEFIIDREINQIVPRLNSRVGRARALFL